MYVDKGTITEDEQTLLARYADDIQGRLKDELLKAKEMPKSFSYDRWIDLMEQGLTITFKDNTTIIGELNTAIKRKPFKQELEHEGRLEEYKQYPKGTRVKANGEIV